MISTVDPKRPWLIIRIELDGQSKMTLIFHSDMLSSKAPFSQDEEAAECRAQSRKLHWEIIQGYFFVLHAVFFMTVGRLEFLKDFV